MIKDYLMDYAIAMPKRFSKYEKAVYIEEVLKAFKEFGYIAKLAVYQNNMKNAKNVIIGDLGKAKMIFVTNYDTPSKVYTHNYKYYPFSPKNNIKEENKSFVVQMIIIFVWIIFGFLCFYFSQKFNYLYKNIFYGMMVACLFFSILNIKARPNKANMTRNSSSIALMMDLARNSKKEYAFILLDKVSNSYVGLHEMDNYLKDNNINIKSPIINLDCVAYGKDVVMAYPNELKDISSKLNQHYCQNNLYLKEFSDEKCETIGLKTLGKQIKISVGDIENNSFYVKNTRSKKDVHINVEQLINIEKMIIDYVKNEE